MRKTNRVEPVNTGANELNRAIMITTTQLEITRRVEIFPIENQSIIDHVRYRSDQPSMNSKHSRKILWYIGCLFITAGILALSIATTGLIIIYKKINGTKKGNIERYDLGDLQYGVTNINFSSNTYLSNKNKIAIQNYLSNQLLNEPGFRGLVIDGVFVQNKLDRSKRKQRDTSCSIIFIFKNIQIYFDYCLTCKTKRNIILHNLFFNITNFRQPFYLILNKIHIFPQICSTPNIFQSTTLSSLTTNLMDISTVVTTDNLLTTQIQETSSMSLIDDTQQTTSQIKTSNIFQFLPFKPSTTILPRK